MPNIFQQIGRTIQGKTKVGKVLHQALPAKKLRSTVGEAILGIKKASPLPEFKDAAVRESVTEADKELSQISTSEEHVMSKINQVRDILDDGKLNDSADDLSPKTKKIIQQVFSAVPLVAYIVYGITTGDFTLSGFLEYVQLFFGL